MKLAYAFPDLVPERGGRADANCVGRRGVHQPLVAGLLASAIAFVKSREAISQSQKIRPAAFVLLVSQFLREREEEIERFPVRFDGQALVLSVRAIIIPLQRNRRVAITRNARLREID